LAQASPDLAFFGSIWPETYLYTLSIAFRYGIFPVAFDLGAQAERIRKENFGALVDINERHNPKFINGVFLELAKDPMRRRRVRKTHPRRNGMRVMQYYKYDEADSIRGSSQPGERISR
jgi:hypothetical protein